MLPTAYRYALPEKQGDWPKDIVDIWKTDVLNVSIQVVRNGGETNLHGHTGTDSMWYVVGGKAYFYDEEDNRYELDVNDMITLPAGTKYWFESVGDEPLELLHIGGRVEGAPATRAQSTTGPEWLGKLKHLHVDELAPTPASQRR